MTEAKWGEQLYFHHRCATCHDVRGQRRRGPHLNGRFGTEVALADGTTVTFDSGYFRVAIRQPQSQIAKGFLPQMPGYEHTVPLDQLQALEAYLRTLP